MFNGVFGLIALVLIAAIVFVQAQRLGGTSGGQQTAQILKSAGGASSSIISALETGQTTQ